MVVLGGARRNVIRHTRNRSAVREGEAPHENRAQLYDEVTVKIIAQLEVGRFPRVQPWETGAGAVAGRSSEPS